MSKRYRNGFKRTLCRWTIPTPSTSYRNVRSNLYINNNNNAPVSPTLVCTNNARHQRATYTNNNPQSDKRPSFYCQRRDNIFTFSMSKYKFVIGSRTLANRQRSLPGRTHRRTSFHYRFSLIEQQERDEQQQQLQSQLQQRKFSVNVIQQQKKNRTRFLFSRSLPPTITPPNSSVSEVKNLPNGNYSKH